MDIKRDPQAKNELRNLGLFTMDVLYDLPNIYTIHTSNLKKISFWSHTPSQI